MVSMTINVPEGCPIQLVCTILMNRDIPNSHRPIGQNVVFLDTQKPRRCPIKKKTWFVMFLYASMLRFLNRWGTPS